MDRLKALLKEGKVDYSEKLFNTSSSIAGLAPNPFVSTIKDDLTFGGHHALETASTTYVYYTYWYTGTDFILFSK